MKDIWEDGNEETKKVNIKKIIMLIAMIVFIIVCIIFISIYLSSAEFRKWIDKNVIGKEISSENATIINISPDDNPQIVTYNKFIATLSKNSLNIYNDSGNKESTLNIKVNNAVFNSSGRFLGIAENGGQRVYLLEGKNIQWEDDIEGEVSQIYVNKNGYMAIVITNTNYKSVVSIYEPNGKEMFKAFSSSTRVLDVTISNDNKYVAIAEIDTSGIKVQSNIKIISVDNAQKDPSNSVIYTYNADINRLITDIKYQDKDKLICMYDDGVDTIENKENQSLFDINNKKLTFLSIELDNNLAYIEEQSSGLFTSNSIVHIVNVNNKKEKLYTLEDNVKEMYSHGDIIGLNCGTEIYFINMQGWLVKKYMTQQEITNVAISDNLAGIIYRDKIEIVKY